MPILTGLLRRRQSVGDLQSSCSGYSSGWVVDTKVLGLEDLLIVDCDVHVHDPPEALAPFADMPWRRSMEHLGGVKQRYLDIPGYATSLNIDPPFPNDGVNTRHVTTSTQMRDELDAMHIDIGVLFPDNLLRMAVFPQTDYAAALGRAYNAWLAEKWVRCDRGLYGAVLAVPQDPEDAADQIRKYGAMEDFVGVYLPVAGVRPLWGDRVYDPIYEAASEMRLPVMLHSVGLIHPNFPFNVDHMTSRMTRHPIQHEFALMANLFSMIGSGLPARFPELDIVFTEGGISWVPYVMWRLDKEFAETPADAPMLERPPSSYIKEMYFCTQPIEEPDRPSDLATMIDLFDGRDHVLFASDWPHHDFDHPRAVMRVPFEAEVKRKIMGETALKLFGISRPVTTA